MTFTASNGVRIVSTNAGETGYAITDEVASGYLGFDEMVAWREYFRAEEDERRGWWRSPVDPHLVCIDGGVAENDGGRRTVKVLDESTFELEHRNDRVLENPGPLTLVQRAARDFLLAHPLPEPKPWDNAQRDEVWLFKSVGNGRALAWRADDGWDVIDQRGNYHRGIQDVPAEMVAHSFYGWENATATRLYPKEEA